MLFAKQTSKDSYWNPKLAKLVTRKNENEIRISPAAFERLYGYQPQKEDTESSLTGVLAGGIIFITSVYYFIVAFFA